MPELKPMMIICLVLPTKDGAISNASRAAAERVRSFQVERVRWKAGWRPMGVK